MRSVIIFILLLPFLSQAQIITTVAGDGLLGYTGDNGIATSAKLHLPGKVLVDKYGNMFISDTYNSVIRKVNAVTNIISTIAGNGIQGYSGDGLPATSAQLYAPYGLALDSSGNLYIADHNNNVIRKVDIAGIITTVVGNGFDAGTGHGGYTGDSGLATNAELFAPASIVFDESGDMFFSDGDNNVIRKVNMATHIITTIAGNGFGAGIGGGYGGYSGDGRPADSAELNTPDGIAFDSIGNLYIADVGNQRIRKIDKFTNIITTFAGVGVYGDTGDGHPATVAEISNPYDIVFDKYGNCYFSEFHCRLRIVDIAGIINNVAGNGVEGYNGDGILADTAELNYPVGISIDPCGNIYIADEQNERIRKITFNPISIITLILTTTSDTICAGTAISYSVTGGAAPYQWQVNGSVVSGATASG